MSVIPTFLKDIYIPIRIFFENNLYNFDNKEDLSFVYSNLSIGNISSSTNKELLKENGITHILSVTSYFNPAYPNDFKYLHIPSYDILDFDLGKFFNQAVNFIKEGTSGENKILVHCMYGKSRSVSMVLAYLMKEKKMPYDIAYEFVKYKRPVMNPNKSFVQQLKKFEYELILNEEDD